MPSKKCIYLLIGLSIFQLLIVLLIFLLRKERPTFELDVRSYHKDAKHASLRDDDNNDDDNNDDDDEAGIHGDGDQNKELKILEDLLRAESLVTSDDDQTTADNNNNENKNNNNINTSHTNNSYKCFLTKKINNTYGRTLADRIKFVMKNAWMNISTAFKRFLTRMKGGGGGGERTEPEDEALAMHSKPFCNLSHQHLVGPLQFRRILVFKDSLTSLKKLKMGGVWSPESCQSHEKVVIIVPYRNRTDQLMAFLRYMHWFLQRQLVHYRIVIMQQTGRALFNRGMLMNVGFSEIKQLQHVDCVIFHDIDLLPENDKILYRCEKMPKHMSAAVSSFHYKLPYSNIFGGVEAFKVAQFHTINGFSNSYFGWGGEDDDLYKRVYLHRLEILRDDQTLARYYMMTHADQTKNPKRLDLLKKSTSRFETDGLNSLVYKCLYVEERPFFTLILVDLDEMFQKQSQNVTSV